MGHGDFQCKVSLILCPWLTHDQKAYSNLMTACDKGLLFLRMAPHEDGSIVTKGIYLHLHPFPHWLHFQGRLLRCLLWEQKAFVWSMRSSLVVVTVCTASLKAIPAQCRSDYGSLLVWGTFHSCVQNGLDRTHYWYILSKASVANTQTKIFPQQSMKIS